MKPILPNAFTEKLTELEQVQRDNHKKIVSRQAYKDSDRDKQIAIDLVDCGINAMIAKYQHKPVPCPKEVVADLRTILELNKTHFTATDPRITPNHQY